MSNRSKSSRIRRPDRPFDAQILQRARAIANRYQIVLKFEDGEWYGRALELPTAMNDGRTPEECIENTRDIVATAVAVMIEDGELPPAPADEGKRSAQVNVRFTPEEKLLLEATAHRRGQRVSDYIRVKALVG